MNKFKFFCNKVLPTIYDNSLSYYEVLCKVANALNLLNEDLEDLEEKTNGNVEKIEDLNKKLKDLQDYVNKQLEAYAKEQLEAWRDDGTLNKLVNDVLNTKLDSVLEMPPLSADNYVGKELVECAWTYYLHNANLFYDNKTALNQFMNADASGRMGIDCSTFVCLVLNGIPYESSRYANPSGGLDANVKEYMWGVNLYDHGTTEVNGVLEYRRYANMIAKWLMLNGGEFDPLEDFSNLNTGDLIFWSNEENPGAYREITHVGIFLSRVSLGGLEYISYIDVSKRGDEVLNPVQVKRSLIGSEWLDEVVCCARTNYNGVTKSYAENVIDGERKKVISSDQTYNQWSFRKKAKSSYYTIVLNGEGTVPIVALKNGNYIPTPKKIAPNTYISHIRSTVEDFGQAVYIKNQTGKTFTVEWVACYEGFLNAPPAEYLTPPSVPDFGKSYLSDNLAFESDSYEKIALTEKSTEFAETFVGKAGALQCKKAGKALVKAKVRLLSTESFVQLRLVRQHDGATSVDVLDASVVESGNHSADGVLSAVVDLRSGDSITLQAIAQSSVTFGAGEFATYLDICYL